MIKSPISSLIFFTTPICYYFLTPISTLHPIWRGLLELLSGIWGKSPRDNRQLLALLDVWESVLECGILCSFIGSSIVNHVSLNFLDPIVCRGIGLALLTFCVFVD